MPTIDLGTFRKALDPLQPLNPSNPEHRKYYVDLSAARQPSGQSACDRLWNKIALIEPHTPRVNLLTGRMGSGKSTELLRLKNRLEQDRSSDTRGFFVVYRDLSQIIDLSKDSSLEVGEIILSIARAVAEQLEAEGCTFPANDTRNVLQQIVDVLNRGIAISEMKLSAGLASVTINFKRATNRTADQRKDLRIALAENTLTLGELVNKELIKPAIEFIRRRNREDGLVIIVDGLDRIYPDTRLDDLLTVPEYIFVAKADHLKQLDCHIVYALPQTLLFSGRYAEMCRGLGVERPELLPMVSVRDRGGVSRAGGIQILGDVVLARAFPDTPPPNRRARIGELFVDPHDLDELCLLSGGNVRDLFGMLIDCLAETGRLPFRTEIVRRAIQSARDNLRIQVSPENQKLLTTIRDTHDIRGTEQASALNFRSFVYEYEDDRGRWFDVNPLIELP